MTAFAKGVIKGVALDVYPKEPLPAGRLLLQREGVVPAPHLGSATVESPEATARETAETMENFFFHQQKTNAIPFRSPKAFTWPGFARVIFDVDSTLCAVEGIDELARMKNKEQEVARLTRQAMDGRVKFESVLARRLELIQPTREEIDRLGKLYCRKILPEAKTLLAILNFLGTETVLLSGGYKQALTGVAEVLKIPLEKVFANELLFDRRGQYRGFNQQNPLCRSGGKKLAVESLGNKATVMIGDGVTDLEAKDSVELFIGFGGLAEREKVKQEALVFIRKHLLAVLPLIIGSSGCERLKDSPWEITLFNSLFYLFQTEVILREPMATRVEKMKQYLLTNFALLPSY